MKRPPMPRNWSARKKRRYRPKLKEVIKYCNDWKAKLDRQMQDQIMYHAR